MKKRNAKGKPIHLTFHIWLNFFQLTLRGKTFLTTITLFNKKLRHMFLVPARWLGNIINEEDDYSEMGTLIESEKRTVRDQEHGWRARRLYLALYAEIWLAMTPYYEIWLVIRPTYDLWLVKRPHDLGLWALTRARTGHHFHRPAGPSADHFWHIPVSHTFDTWAFWPRFNLNLGMGTSISMTMLWWREMLMIWLL